MTKLRTIREFLEQRRLAIVGVSRDPRSYSRQVLKEFLSRDYDVIAVSHTADEIERASCVRRVSDISPPPDAAILLVREDSMAAALADCLSAGVGYLWVRRISSSVQRAMLDLPEERRENLKLIQGLCPLMFLANTGFVHRLHGQLIRAFGQYPR